MFCFCVVFSVPRLVFELTFHSTHKLPASYWAPEEKLNSQLWNVTGKSRKTNLKPVSHDPPLSLIWVTKNYWQSWSQWWLKFRVITCNKSCKRVRKCVWSLKNLTFSLYVCDFCQFDIFLFVQKNNSKIHECTIFHKFSFYKWKFFVICPLVLDSRRKLAVDTQDHGADQ